MSALQQAKALHKLKKVYRRGLLKKHVQQSRLGTVAAAQDHYIIKIHLTTDKTGKKKNRIYPQFAYKCSSNKYCRATTQGLYDKKNA